MRTHLFAIATLAMLASLADGAAQRMLLRSGSIRMPAGSQHAARAAAYCVDGHLPTPKATDPFNHFSGDISVTRTVGGKSETKPINEVLGKWVSARGFNSTKGIEFISLDPAADLRVDIGSQKGPAIAGADTLNVREYLDGGRGADLIRLLKPLDQVSEEAAKLHPELGTMADGLRQDEIWDLPVESRAANIPDAAELKQTLRERVGIPEGKEIPEGLVEILLPPGLKGVDSDKMAEFFGYKISRNEALKADLRRVAMLKADAAAINERLGTLSDYKVAELAQEIIDGRMGAGKTVVSVFQDQMRSAVGLEEDSVPSLKSLNVAMRGVLGDGDPQALAKLLDLKVVPKEALDADISAMDGFARSWEINDPVTRRLVDQVASETTLRALRGELSAGSLKAAFQKELRETIGLPQLTQIDLAEFRVFLPDGLGKLNAGKLGELFGIQVKDEGSRNLVLLESGLRGFRLKGSMAGRFESLEEALKAMKGGGNDLEVIVSRVPTPADAKLLNDHGIHFVKQKEVFRSELQRAKTKPVKIIVVSSLDAGKAGKLFETKDPDVLESIRKGTKALDEAARGGMDIIIVDSREALEKAFKELGDDDHPVLVVHSSKNLRIGFADGDFDLMDGPSRSVLTCDSYRLGEVLGDSLVSTGLLDYERLVKSVIDGAKKAGGAPAQDKVFFRVVEAGYRKGDALRPGVTVAIGGGGAAGGVIIYMLLGATSVEPSSEEEEKKADKDAE